MLLRTGVLACLLFVLFPFAAVAGSARGIGAGSGHACVVTPAGGVQCWGDNTYGQLGDGTTSARSAPVDVVGLAGQATAVAAGASFSCALTSDHTVQCWGYNNSGQLGNNTLANSSTPVAVSGLSDAVALAAGASHACALRTGGTVQCWGYNLFGQLGDGTVVSKSTPVTVSGLAGVAGVMAGGRHNCVVMTDGSARCWGDNSTGQLGDGSTTEKHSPVAVTGLTGVLAMAAGTQFTCALQVGGAVACWGRNQYGQLGDGTTEDRDSTAAVTGLASGVAAIAAGFTNACAVLGTGALKCWGDNTDGQVGDGTTTSPRTTAMAVSGLTSGVATVAIGDGHACALLSIGGVQCWGKNASGQLGDGTTASHLSPANVSGLAGGETLTATGAAQVSVSLGTHACAVTNGGGLQCWGNNGNGQLGDGTTTFRATPVTVHGLASGVASVATGGNYTCALTIGGGVKCWGWGGGGELGDGTATSRLTPVDVQGLSAGVVAVAGGNNHACALTSAGGVKCWGQNIYGQLGDSTTTLRSTPVNVTGLTSGVTAISAGYGHTCAVSTTGGVRCWGYNARGQLGDGTTTDRSTAVWVSGLTSGVVEAAAGTWHSCALTTGGAVRCWGRNLEGQLGDGTTADRTTPAAVSGLASGQLSLAAGSLQTCARTAGGGVRCWGANDYGQLGDGTTTTPRTTPVAVRGLMSGVTSLDMGAESSCAVTSRKGVQCWGRNGLGDGTVAIARSTPGWVVGFVAEAGRLAGAGLSSCRVTAAGGVQCWGYNAYGQVGDGTTRNRRTAVDVSGLASGVVSVSVGNAYACAVTTAGAVKCWGFNGAGELGDGTTTDRATPVDVAGLAGGATAVVAGRYHACAVTAAGGVMCWGSNSSGQLGDGTTTARSSAAYVLGLTSGVAALALGGNHTCALTSGGGVLCWGENSLGALGNGTVSDSLTPKWVTGLKSGVGAIAGSLGHTCALTAAGAVLCWGQNLNGELGDGSTTNRTTPVAVSGLAGSAVGLAAGGLNTCATVSGVGVSCWGDNLYGQLGDGTTTDRWTPVAVSGLSSEAATVAAAGSSTCVATASGVTRCWGANDEGEVGDGTTTDRLTPSTLRGFKLKDDYDADVKADIAVYRPSTGTWFSLNSSSGNASYQYRGWGVQAQGDVPVPGCDFDGDGIVDPTVFRPSSGTWFFLKSELGFTTWDYFGWGSAGDTPVPADYDGDGITDGAVSRPSTGVWYVRPSGGGIQWNVTFGNSTDVPIPGYYDADGKADIAVYRPSTGTWFVLTSSSGWASYWYRGWGVNAQGDTPAPGDYDGDGRMDLCVFRATTGTWFILESHASFTTWNYYGWGANGDTVVPSDYDGDGITDAAVYRPSNYTWYVRPSSGASQWSVVFGASGDVPLVTIR